MLGREFTPRQHDQAQLSPHDGRRAAYNPTQLLRTTVPILYVTNTPPPPRVGCVFRARSTDGSFAHAARTHTHVCELCVCTHRSYSLALNPHLRSHLLSMLSCILSQDPTHACHAMPCHVMPSCIACPSGLSIATDPANQVGISALFKD